MGVDQGERIHPNQVADLMRRINAIQAKTWTSGALVRGGGIAIDDDDVVHVERLDNDTISRYENDGTVLSSYSVSGNFLGWGGSGHIYTRSGVTLKRYTKLGVLIGTHTMGTSYDIVHPGTALDGKMYALDWDDAPNTTGEIFRLNNTGTTVEASATWSPISSDPDIQRPASLCTDPDGNVYAWFQDDELTHGVRKYNSSLSLQDEWSVDESTEGEPFQSGATSGQRTVMVNNLSESLRQFTATGNIVGVIDAPNSTPGYVGVDSNDDLYITEFEGESPVTLSQIDVYDLAGIPQRSWNIRALSQPIAQTEWFRYPTTSLIGPGGKVSLGTPDGGVAIPALDALEFDIIRPNYTEDMHEAIEAVLVYWKNAVTGNPFDFDNLSADNLYNVAVEAGVYNWQIPGLVGDHGTRITEEWIDEIDSCLTKLEESELV